jgi:hypothetical protein
MSISVDDGGMIESIPSTSTSKQSVPAFSSTSSSNVSDKTSHLPWVEKYRPKVSFCL